MAEEFYQCPDCEQPIVSNPDSLCSACQRWRDERYAAMDEEYQRKQARRARMRMSPGARFGEELADVAKAIERSR